MITKNTKKNEIRISLNKEFYSVDSVKEAIKKFARITNGKITVKKDIHITLHPKDKKLVGILGYEFSNYVLSIMKNKNLV